MKTWNICLFMDGFLYMWLDMYLHYIENYTTDTYNLLQVNWTEECASSVL